MEKIIIHRHPNPRLGYHLSSSTSTSETSNDKDIDHLINLVNHEFKICSNRQTQCLLSASIDPHNTLTFVFMIILLVPIVKGVLLDNFDLATIEYVFIFICGMIIVSYRYR